MVVKKVIVKRINNPVRTAVIQVGIVLYWKVKDMYRQQEVFWLLSNNLKNGAPASNEVLSGSLNYGNEYMPEGGL